MNNGQDKPFVIVVQSLCEWFASLGGIASLLLGLLLLGIITMMLLFFRWIRRGGLKPQSTTNFFRRQQLSEQFCRNPIDRR